MKYPSPPGRRAASSSARSVLFREEDTAGLGPENEDRLAAALRVARGALEEILAHQPTAAEAEVIEPVLQAIMMAESGALAPGARTTGILSRLDDPAGQRIRELEDALRARDEFISTIGHELKNPVTPILLQVRQLLTTLANAPGGVVPAEPFIPRVESMLGRLRKFINTLNRILDVSRISSGKIDLHLEEIDLAEVVRGVAADMERELLASKSALTVLAPENVVGRWDRMRLEQIASNLLSNAIRYGLGNPISIRVAAEGGAAVLEVRDEGVGIADEEQERIFERFERGVGSRQAGGFGVGLWVVKRLCKALGGDIDVESRVGQGSAFTVTLPRTERSVE